jgi:hypothetical protein
MTARAMPSPLHPSKPWYRQRWPWLLMAGPAIVVVAGLVTAWIAVTTDDGLVSQDYYKRGLLINKDLERASRAVAMKLGASVRVAPDGSVDVEMTGLGEGAAAPGRLNVTFGRAARSGQDVVTALPRTTDRRYAGRVAPLTAGRWLVTLEADDWRLATVAAISLPGEVRLGSARAVD